MYGHFASFSLVGRTVADVGTDPDDGLMTGAAPARTGPAASAPAIVAADLEWFWPSRRSYAFDELCRSSAR